MAFRVDDGPVIVGVAAWCKRHQAATILTRALKLAPVAAQAAVTLADRADLPVWAAAAIQQVANTGLMRGYTDGAFHASDMLTRAQVAVLVQNYLRAKK